MIDASFAGLRGRVAQARTPRQEVDLVRALCALHDRRIHREGLLLYAGSNELSPACKAMLASDTGGVPAMGRPGEKDQPATAEISALEVLVERQLTAIFGGAFAEARLPNCTTANALLYRMIAGTGGRIAALGADAGGHVSSQASGTPRLFDAEVIELPFDAATLDLDAPRAAALIEAERPALVIVGASVALRALSIDAVAPACRHVGAVLVADIAHTAGLVAGGLLPNPLLQGADFITGSTYKSLGGPPGAFIVAADTRHEAALRALVCPIFTSNYDAARLAALAVALAEVREFMSDYAAAMIDNAMALRTACAARGMERIAVPETAPSTHQVLLPIGDAAAARALVLRGDAAGIFVGANAVPGRRGAYGLRIGTQVVTRRGMARHEMELIADLLSDLCTDVSVANIARRVAELTAAFPDLKYGYA